MQQLPSSNRDISIWLNMNNEYVQWEKGDCLPLLKYTRMVAICFAIFLREGEMATLA